MPPIRYPDELPVSQRRDDIAAAIRDHQVVVVAGETGSGKTTQLPKICLELGRGRRAGMIGHTQPRRIAARTRRRADRRGARRPAGRRRSATRCGSPTTRRDTLVKLMTDGILLAELQHDRMLLRYDTLIIDEAHERSLNIDFLLGYLKQLLPRRPDLKVVITSATIDPERFAGTSPTPARRPDHRGVRAHLPGRGPLPAAGRGVGDGDDGTRRASPSSRDQTEAIVDAVRELVPGGPRRHAGLPARASARSATPPTRWQARRAAGRARSRSCRCTRGCPRPSSTGSSRAHSRRRVVLATNVAETSLTVPGIRYVVDAGTARISRYSHRTKVQRLPIEPISQASANQRAGRCGRVEAGICIRLYAEEDFAPGPSSPSRRSCAPTWPR